MCACAVQAYNLMPMGTVCSFSLQFPLSLDSGYLCPLLLLTKILSKVASGEGLFYAVVVPPSPSICFSWRWGPKQDKQLSVARFIWICNGCEHGQLSTAALWFMQRAQTCTAKKKKGITYRHVSTCFKRLKAAPGVWADQWRCPQNNDQALWVWRWQEKGCYLKLIHSSITDLLSKRITKRIKVPMKLFVHGQNEEEE